MLMPTQKEFAAIYLIPKLANSETAQTFAKEASTLPVDAVRLMKSKMEQWAEDTMKEKEPVKTKGVKKEE
jgi:hypothetical protein